MAISVPPPQNNYEIALKKAWEVLGERELAQLTVLNQTLTIDSRRREIVLPDGNPPGIAWQILILHYLAAESPPPAKKEITFTDIPEARGYWTPYSGRVIGRIARLFDRQADEVKARAMDLGAEPMGPGDLAFRFQVFPFAAVTLCWYQGEDDLPPGATVVYQDNLPYIFCVEDIVVMTELLITLLSKRHW